MNKMFTPWTDDDTATAHRLMATGADEATCWATLGRTFRAVQDRVTIIRQREASAARTDAENRMMRARIAAAREQACAEQSITAALFGDPLPGRSALDQRGGLA